MAATTPKHLDPAHAAFKLQRQRTACSAAFPQIEYGITLAATTTSSGPSIGFASAVGFLVDHPRDTAQSVPCLQRPTLALSHQNRCGCLVRAGPVSTSEQNPLARPLVSKAGSGERRRAVVNKLLLVESEIVGINAVPRERVDRNPLSDRARCLRQVTPARRLFGGRETRSGRESSIVDELADAEVHGAPLVLREGDGLPGLQDPLEECPVLF
jgi:hypothetical protein